MLQLEKYHYFFLIEIRNIENIMRLMGQRETIILE